MRLNRNILLFLILFISRPVTGQDLNQGIDVYNFESIALREGLSNLEIRSLCQDSLGYIWIGTDRGLDRFDGDKPEPFASFSRDSGFYYNSIWGLQALSDKVIIETPKEVWSYDLKKEELTEISGSSYFFYIHNTCVWRNTYYHILRDSVLLYYNIDSVNLLPVKDFPDHLRITKIFSDVNEGIWCTGSDNNEIILFNPLTGKTRSFDILNNELPGLNEEIQDIKSINGFLWIGTKSGLVLYNYTKGRIILNPVYFDLKKTLENKDIRFINKKEKEVWIGTYRNGLYVYNLDNSTLKQFSKSKGDNGLKTNNFTVSLFDRDNNIWLGTFNKGLQVNYHNRKKFNTNSYINELTRDKFINCILTDKYGTFYFGTRYNGIISFNPSTLKQKSYNTSNSSLLNNHITSLFLDSKGNLWIGQENHLQIFDPSTDELRSVDIPKSFGEVVSINEFKGKVYICGAYLFVLDLQGNRVQIYNDFGNNIRQTVTYRDSVILVCGHGMIPGKISRLSYFKPETQRIDRIEPTMMHKAWQDAYFITTYFDSDSILWIGSFYWGLIKYNIEKDEIRVYTKKDGLPSNDVIAIIEDDYGNLWLSTYYGLSCFDKKETFTNYFLDEGLDNQQFHQKAVYKHTDGTVFFGGYSGVTYFKPGDILTASPSRPSVQLKTLNVNYKTVFPGDQNKVLDKGMSYTSSVVLSHRQRTFSLDYIAFNYGLAHKTEYKYILEGYHENWLEVGKTTRAVFSNLRPGRYTFKVKARNSESDWSEPVSLGIRVKQTPWFSTWAILIYFLVVFCMTLFAFSLILKAKLYRKDLKVEHTERLRQQEVNQMKLRFFTNISHEIRTPLTIISTMVYMLTKQLKPEDSTNKLLGSLRLNVDRLLRLINQLLLFREMENDALKLNLSELKISQVLNRSYEAFIYFARVKNISFNLNLVETIQDKVLYYDYDKVEKILTNLISNALKNTSTEGKINISAGKLSKDEALVKYRNLDTYDFPVSEEGYMECRVEDTGFGISEEDIVHIFERFRKSEKNKGKVDYSGSGIGLDFTKRLINLHKGDIRVSSKINEGSVFSFILPLGKKVYSDVKAIEFVPEISIPAIIREEYEGKEKETIHSGEAPGRYTLLVVEDNEELRDLMVNILKPVYRVLSAGNGEDGLKLAENEFPDLIISDIKMPVMDGLTLCSKIKKNQVLNHIYLILLSAKSETSDQIEGMRKGADMYINKPFHVDYLLAVIDAHFKRRKRLALEFSKGIAPMLNQGEENPEYKSFIEKLHVILDRELSNENLNVQMLAERMNMSRSNFYRKFESVTGISPNAYIVKSRMNKAEDYMKSSDLSIAEISLNVGFSNPAYFSTLFKKEKGLTPSKFIRENRN